MNRDDRIPATDLPDSPHGDADPLGPVIQFVAHLIDGFLQQERLFYGHGFVECRVGSLQLALRAGQSTANLFESHVLASDQLDKELVSILIFAHLL